LTGTIAWLRFITQVKPFKLELNLKRLQMKKRHEQPCSALSETPEAASVCSLCAGGEACPGDGRYDGPSKICGSDSCGGVA